MKFLFLCAFMLTLFLSCTANHSLRTYSTWSSLGETISRTKEIAERESPPLTSQPWAGTVSHHLLAYVQIDRWFEELAQRRSVETFFILSPSHWGLSTQLYSLTDGNWRTKTGTVASDVTKTNELSRRLNVEFDVRVFDAEHGVATLVPFVEKYFPKSKIVALAYRGEAPVNVPMADGLAKALAPYFNEEGKKYNFLLVSTDFAHHGNLSGTQLKDERTEKFFRNPSVSTWIFAGCDNRPGIYCIAQFATPATKNAVLFHTNSWELSGEDASDITSYFMSYFWD